MKKSGLPAGVDAKPGKENEVLLFLKSFKPLASDVAGTVSWQALKIGPFQDQGICTAVNTLRKLPPSIFLMSFLLYPLSSNPFVMRG